MPDLSKVTRVEVIDGYGRTYASYNADDLLIVIQDEGHTLKVMHTGDTSHGVTEDHKAEFADYLDQLAEYEAVKDD